MAKKKSADALKTEAAKILGRLGGLARAKNLSKEERRESARTAINARWEKYRKEQQMKSRGKRPKIKSE